MVSEGGSDEAALLESYGNLHHINPELARQRLKEAKEIMGQLGIPFFLRQGTCLGAVRDQAFIPWDDDIDLGCVIGLNGLTEDMIAPVLDAFREHGYFVSSESNDRWIAAGMMKSSLRMDLTFFRIIDDSIFHFPGIRIPVRLLTQLKEIDFIGEKFLVPNPPEEYLRLKYGDDWMIPQQKGYEKDILQLIPAAPIPGRPGRLRQFLGKYTHPEHVCRLKVLDGRGEPVSGADVIVPGLGRFKTNKRGDAKFYLDGEEWYALIISFGNHEEILYQEMLAPGSSYIYRPDPSTVSGRLCALSVE